MVKQAEKDRMRDYLVDRLRAGGAVVEPVTKELVSGAGEANYLRVGNDGVVFLVDRAYPRNRFSYTLRFMREKRQNVATVFYKGYEDSEHEKQKIFFRSYAQDVHFKANDLSLKNYTHDQVNRMILLRPEEVLIANEGLQYYQPNSERLTEGVRSFRFSPVHYDYNHLAGTGRFRPQNRDSTKVFIWTSDNFYDGPLQLNARSVGPVVAPVQPVA